MVGDELATGAVARWSRVAPGRPRRSFVSAGAPLSAPARPGETAVSTRSPSSKGLPRSANPPLPFSIQC